MHIKLTRIDFDSIRDAGLISVQGILSKEKGKAGSLVNWTLPFDLARNITETIAESCPLKLADD